MELEKLMRLLNEEIKRIDKLIDFCREQGADSGDWISKKLEIEALIVKIVENMD